MLLVRVIKKIRSEMQRHLYSYLYIRRDVSSQKRRLADYATSITSVTNHAALDSAMHAAFVYYEPEGDVSPSVTRAVEALRRKGVNTLLLCNHDLSPQQTAFFAKQCASVILRTNQGFDFGAYKDVVAHLTESGQQVDRLLFLNDSVFYASAGLDEFITSLLGPEDVIAGHENWSEDHHLQSFALSVSGSVFKSQEFQRFWASYVPISNRSHAIEVGEKGLTTAILATAESTRVIFAVSDLERALSRSNDEVLSAMSMLPQPWRDGFGPTAGLTRAETVTKVIQIINSTSTIHSGAYYFPKHLQSPLFKKDLVYRSRFKFWEVENWIHEVLPDDEAEEFLTILRKRRDSSTLSNADKRRFMVGVK